MTFLDSTPRSPAIDDEHGVQGRLFGPAVPQSPATSASSSPTAVAGDTSAPDACFGRRHRRRAGDIVRLFHPLYDRHGALGVVLSDGLDVHRNHVGWVGVPGRCVHWLRLCHLQEGDAEQFDRELSAAREAGLVVRFDVALGTCSVVRTGADQ